MDNQENNAKAKKKSIFKKWWFWVIIVVVIAIAAGVGAGGNSNDNNSSQNSSQNQSENSSSSSKQSEKQSEPAAKEFKMNETVTIGDYEVTITDVYDTKLIGSDLVGAKTENNFVVVTASIKNTSSKEKTFTSSNISLKNGNLKYDSHNSAGIYLGDTGFYALKDIGAGLTKTISFVFETPGEHTESYFVQIKDTFKSEDIYLK